MQKTTLGFPRNARRVYTAVKHVFETRTRFGNIRCDDTHFAIEARRGWFVSPMSESVKIKVVAMGNRAEPGYYWAKFALCSQFAYFWCKQEKCN